MNHTEANQYIKATLAVFGPSESINMAQDTWSKLHEAMTVLIEQQAEQEPVATVQHRVPEGVEAHLHQFLPVGTKLYTAPQPAIPPGHKLVPVEPTEAQIKAGDKYAWPYPSTPIYRAMLDAAPEAPQPKAKQEPVTCAGCKGNGMVGNILDTVPCPFCNGPGTEAPQHAKRVSLTDEEIDEIAGGRVDYFDRRVFARAIERAHGITGGDK